MKIATQLLPLLFILTLIGLCTQATNDFKDKTYALLSNKDIIGLQMSTPSGKTEPEKNVLYTQNPASKMEMLDTGAVASMSLNAFSCFDIAQASRGTAQDQVSIICDKKTIQRYSRKQIASDPGQIIPVEKKKTANEISPFPQTDTNSECFQLLYADIQPTKNNERLYTLCQYKATEPYEYRIVEFQDANQTPSKTFKFSTATVFEPNPTFFFSEVLRDKKMFFVWKRPTFEDNQTGKVLDNLDLSMVETTTTNDDAARVNQKIDQNLVGELFNTITDVFVVDKKEFAVSGWSTDNGPHGLIALIDMSSSLDPKLNYLIKLTWFTKGFIGLNRVDKDPKIIFGDYDAGKCGICPME